MLALKETGLVDALAIRVSCDAIESSDLPAIADLLHVGFPNRTRTYWANGLQRLARLTPPDGFPKFGYMLRASDRPVGVHLLISSLKGDEAQAGVRCNVSSWYVSERFRSYGSFLLQRACKRSATYVNISPEPATLPIIEALGFRKFSQGVFAAAPLLARRRTKPIRLLGRDTDWVAGVPVADLNMLRDHQAFGCHALWCETGSDGQVLIFRRRWVKPGLPAAQLVYCRSLSDLVRVAGPVSRYLAAGGLPLMLVPCDRPLPGLVGRFFPQKLPMYARGPQQLRPEDLSYTEAALFGM
jgi:hypothetical protein